MAEWAGRDQVQWPSGQVGIMYSGRVGRSGSCTVAEWAGRDHVQWPSGQVGISHTVSESGRLSESRADCQRVGQTVSESGRLSVSRADCQSVGQTVRASGRLSEPGPLRHVTAARPNMGAECAEVKQ